MRSRVLLSKCSGLPRARPGFGVAALATMAWLSTTAVPHPVHATGERVDDAVYVAVRKQGSAVVHLDFEIGLPRAPAPRSPAEARERRDRIAAVADDILRSLAGQRVDVLRRFALVNALTLRVDRDALEVLEADPRIIGIDLDEPGRLHMDEAGPLVNVDDVHLDGFKGTGVTVAVIDTGIDTNHSDISGDISDEVCYCLGGCCPNGLDTQTGSGAAEDANGHGTHVSGIITSEGTTAPEGFAPDAEVVAIRISGSSGMMSMSDVVSALDWVDLNAPDVSVVNLSLGSFTRFSGDCDSSVSWTRSMATAVDNLVADDVAVFASSGNAADSSSMSAPACIADVISVGSVYDANVGSVTFPSCSDSSSAADQITCYSNDSSTLDLLAPGSAITSTRLNGGKITFHGTSMASPAAAACAALLYEANPTLTSTELESSIESSNTTLTDGRSNRSHPRLDCAEALAAATPDTDGDGISDFADNCPAVSNAAQDDRDADGLGDVCDTCPDDPDNDTDEDTVCGDVDNCPEAANANQADGDSDAIGDVCDICPADPNNDVDEDTVCGDIDNCPATENADQQDGDSDAIGDACDVCPADPDNDADGDGVCGDVDNCPAVANSDQADFDGDARGDACDVCPADPENDADGDTVCGDVDNCPAIANTAQSDRDADLRGDVCDACVMDADNDADGDGVCGDVDNCPAVANTAQENADGDSAGDICDVCVMDPDDDIDEDGLCGDLDNCPTVANVDQADEDVDGRGDACDACPSDPDDDADGDEVCGDVDNCPATTNPGQDDRDADGDGDACDACPEDSENDADGDGICEASDNCPMTANAAQLDSDLDGPGDACDACPEDADDDADGDGVCGDVDNCPAVANPAQRDGDGDGVGDACQPEAGCTCVGSPDGGSDPRSALLPAAILFGLALGLRPRRRPVATASFAEARPAMSKPVP